MQMTILVQTRNAGSDVIVLSEMRAAVSPDVDMDGLRKKSSNRVVLTRCLKTFQSRRDFPGGKELRGNAAAIRDESNRNKRIRALAKDAAVVP